MNGIMTLLRPEAFQGAGRKAPYFEGWYFKLQAPDGSIFALIPGVSKSGSDPHSFIQVIAGGASGYLRYPVDAFSYRPGQFDFLVGDSHFCAGGIKLDTELVQGEVEFTGSVPFQRHRYGLGIMGPFALAPMLECRHGVVTVLSSLRGHIATKNGETALEGGLGYIEKDWGSVFPNPYVWAQAFFKGGGSLMISAARVPVLGCKLRGLAAFLYDGRQIHHFTTYGGAALRELTCQSGQISLAIASPHRLLRLVLRPGSNVSLKAPESGGMGREIRESVAGSVMAVLEKGGRTSFVGVSHSASIEICGDITSLCR